MIIAARKAKILEEVLKQIKISKSDQNNLVKYISKLPNRDFISGAEKRTKLINEKTPISKCKTALNKIKKKLSKVKNVSK